MKIVIDYGGGCHTTIADRFLELGALSITRIGKGRIEVETPGPAYDRIFECIKDMIESVANADSHTDEVAPIVRKTIEAFDMVEETKVSKTVSVVNRPLKHQVEIVNPTPVHTGRVYSFYDALCDGERALFIRSPRGYCRPGQQKWGFPSFLAEMLTSPRHQYNKVVLAFDRKDDNKIDEPLIFVIDSVEHEKMFQNLCKTLKSSTGKLVVIVSVNDIKSNSDYIIGVDTKDYFEELELVDN